LIVGELPFDLGATSKENHCGAPLMGATSKIKEAKFVPLGHYNH